MMFTSSNPLNIGPPQQILPMMLTSDWVNGGAPNNGALVANTAYYLPLVPFRNGGVSAITVNCNSANGNLDLGIYTYSGSLIASEGAQAAVLGNNVWTPASPIPVSGGVQYWVAISVSSGTSTWCRYTGSAVLNYGIGMLIQASAHPLPSTATFALGGTAAAVPIIVVDFV